MLGKEDRTIRVAVFCEIDDKELFFAGDPTREEIELLQLQENKQEQYFYVEKETLENLKVRLLTSFEDEVGTKFLIYKYGYKVELM